MELMEYGSTLFSVNNSLNSSIECEERYFRSFEAHNSTRSNFASPAALISVSRSAYIVVAPLSASFIITLRGPKINVSLPRRGRIPQQRRQRNPLHFRLRMG